VRGTTSKSELHAADETVCIQPACLLRSPYADRAFLAELLVSVIAREHVEELVPDSLRIVPRDVCTTCVLRVMDGGHTFLTEAEHQRRRDLGHWSYRRRRRRE
jgi:hypothetical protein